MRSRRLFLVFILVALAVATAAPPAAAQDGKLKISVNPKEAYVFVDGRALGDGGRTLRLAPGTHEIGVYNYGYKPSIQSVNITAGETTRLDVSLESVGGSVSGPWGRIQIEGAGRAAVLLNGKTPDYLVGHGDEFNHDWIWKQELLVPPGTHQVTLTRDGDEIWSGSVAVAANQRVIIDARKGSQKTTDWARGGKLGSLAPFKAGIASATVGVNPSLISSFTATPGQINCGDSSRLAWQTSGAIDSWLNNDKVRASGEQLVSPRATTNYTLAATGPGGRVERSASVNVNTAITGSLTLAREMRYRKIGDKVVEHGTATLNWSTANASSVGVDPFGAVSASGTRTVQPSPRQTAFGPVSESVQYRLTASNVCGGTFNTTATLNLVGSIEPLPEVLLASVFFPTDYPDERNPNLGLVRSQQRALALLAQGFKKYLEYDSAAKLLLEGHADERRSEAYNRELSQRRAHRVKQYLVDQGIPAANIEATAFGEERNLDRKTVKDLEARNPAKAPRRRLGNLRGNWLAHNRRVDIVLRPTAQPSPRYYPHTADDADLLWQVPKPARSVVEKNQ